MMSCCEDLKETVETDFRLLGELINNREMMQP